MVRLVLVWIASATAALAQELAPRTYWPSPKGVKVAVFGYACTDGDVLFDPSTPLYGVDSQLNLVIAAYLQTFGLWGRTANLLIEQPISWGTTSGLVVDESASRDSSGRGDLALKLTVNLMGAPAMTAPEFQQLRADPHPILGASLKIVAPTGHYDEDRLVNVGANRWAVKGELGYIAPLHRKWLFEVAGGVWLFGDNADSLAGRREQDPIYGLELHLIHRFRPGFWASLDANYFIGGRQTIGGNQLEDVQRNSRVGATVVVPFKKRHAVKVGFSSGVVTEFGTDFQQVLATYQVLFR